MRIIIHLLLEFVLGNQALKLDQNTIKNEVSVVYVRNSSTEVNSIYQRKEQQLSGNLQRRKNSGY